MFLSVLIMSCRLDLQEVRLKVFENAHTFFHAGRVDCEEAAQLIGVLVSTFYRMRCKYRDDGLSGLDARETLCIQEERTVTNTTL